jgi:hypothetical protein
MRTKLLLVLLLASFTGLAQTHVYIGSYRVADGQCWHDVPATYTGQEAAALIFGGSASDYAISVNSSTTDPTTITHTAYLDGWGDITHLITPASESYKLNTTYLYPAFSAYIKDHSDGNTYLGSGCEYLYNVQYTNHVWWICTVSASIADVTTYCSKNTIYKGYGPTSITLTVSPSGGVPPYTYSWSPGGATTASVTVSPASTTVYTATVTDSKGCSSTASVTVYVKDVRCGKNNDKVMVCHYTGSSTNPSNALCIAAAGVADHLAHGDCLGDCTSAYAKMLGSTNMINSEQGNVIVYPNPASGKINVELKETGSAYLSYQIIDITGRTVGSQPMGGIHSGLMSVDISDLAAGVYIFRAVTEDGINQTRFTVK